MACFDRAEWQKEELENVAYSIVVALHGIEHDKGAAKDLVQQVLGNEENKNSIKNWAKGREGGSILVKKTPYVMLKGTTGKSATVSQWKEELNNIPETTWTAVRRRLDGIGQGHVYDKIQAQCAKAAQPDQGSSRGSRKRPSAQEAQHVGTGTQRKRGVHRTGAQALLKKTAKALYAMRDGGIAFSVWCGNNGVQFTEQHGVVNDLVNMILSTAGQGVSCMELDKVAAALFPSDHAEVRGKSTSTSSVFHTRHCDKLFVKVGGKFVLKNTTPEDISD